MPVSGAICAFTRCAITFAFVASAILRSRQKNHANRRAKTGITLFDMRERCNGAVQQAGSVSELGPFVRCPDAAEIGHWGGRLSVNSWPCFRYRKRVMRGCRAHQGRECTHGWRNSPVESTGWRIFEVRLAKLGIRYENCVKNAKLCFSATA